MAFSLTKKVALLSSIRHILSSRQHDLIFLRASPSAPAPVSERQLPGSQARLGRHPQGCRAGRASAHPLSVEGETNNDAQELQRNLAPIAPSRDASDLALSHEIHLRISF